MTPPLSGKSDTQTGASPGKPRDEAIKHKMTIAITEADNLLRVLYADALYDETSTSEIRRVRGLLAEWRLETGG